MAMKARIVFGLPDQSLSQVCHSLAARWLPAHGRRPWR
jgi:hypothetical protein